MKLIVTYWQEIGAILLMHQTEGIGHTKQEAYTNAKKKINKLFTGKIKILIDRVEKI